MADPKDPVSFSEKEIESFKKSLVEIQDSYERLQKKSEEFNKSIENGTQQELTKQEILLKQIDFGDKINKKKQEELKLLIQIEKQQEQINEELIKQYETQLDNLEVLEQQREKAKEITEETRKFGQSAAGAFSSFTGIGGSSTTLLGNMVQLAGKGGSFKGAMAEAGQQIGRMLTPANLLSAAIDKATAAVKGIINITIDYAKEQDRAFATFEKEVGNVDRYQSQIDGLRNANGRFGVSITEAAKTFQSFKKEFAGFEQLSVAQQNALAETSARLGKLGIAETDVIKTQEMLIKGMGMTVKQSTDLQKSLYGTALAMGLPPKQVAADFAKAAPELAKHGKNMTNVFLDLQNNAKNTGIAFERLIAITEKFDTFEGAAESAGKLNAILGGDYLNSIDLLNASEGERVRLMQEALQASGKTFETMSIQERKATAQALGISDLTELQKLMNNETTKGTVEAMRAEEAQKKMNEAIGDATELTDAFKNLMMKLAIEMRPVIEAIKNTVMGITGWLDKNPKLAQAIAGGIVLFAGLVTVVLGVATAFMALGTAAASLNTMMAATSAAGTAAGAGGNAAAAGIRSVGMAAQQSAVGLLAIGATILLIGAGIAIAALGMAQLVKSFIGIGDAAWPAAAAIVGFTIAFGLMILVMVKLAPAALAASSGLFAISGAALLLGTAMAVASAGFGFMIKAVSELVKSIMELFNALSKADPANIAKSFDALFDSLSLARIGKFTAFAGAADGVAESIGNINKSLTEMIAKMAIVETLNFSPKVNSPSTTQTATPVANTISTTTAAAAATMNTTTGGGAAGGGTNIVPVAVYLDSKKIGEILDPRIKQTIQDSLKNIGSKTAAIGI
jgi:hypothetical protein